VPQPFGEFRADLFDPQVSATTGPTIGNHRTFLMESVQTTGSPKPKGVLIESTYKAFVKALLKCEVNDLLLETI